MKTSQFNIFFDYQDQKIGFNSYTREYIAIDPMIHLMYESAKKGRVFDDLQSYYPEFYDFLYEKGFLIEDEIDEIELVKEMVELVDKNDSYFQLHINPTMNCNFKCWYCYETHIKDSKMDEATIEHTIKFVNGILKSNKGTLELFSLDWFGGEPLLYFKKVVQPILKEVYELCEQNNVDFRSGITTNGLLVNDEVVEISKKYNLIFYQITLDGHRDRHDTIRFISEGRGSYDSIVSNIKLLAKNGILVNIRINCSPETLQDIEKILEDFENLGNEDKAYIEFDLHKVWQDEGNVEDEELYQIRWNYRQKGFKVKTGSHDHVDNSCYGDRKNHATINYNGETFKCTARDFNTENSEGILSDQGTIEWNEKYHKRMNSKFKNKPCLECAILPICNGGCSQQALEHEDCDYCINDFDENKKRAIVINRFKEALYETD